MTFPPVFVVITLRGGVAEGLGEDVGVGCFGLAGTLQEVISYVNSRFHHSLLKMFIFRSHLLN